MPRELNHNKTLADSLRRITESGHIVNAYLLSGQSEAAKEVALYFASLILCSDNEFNPDLITVKRSGAHLLTSDIEELQENLKFKSFSDRRVVLIEDADLLIAAGQNKLLKTLEEPSVGTTIILLAERRDALLPTVLSRCIEFTVEPIPKEVSDLVLECAKDFLSKVSKGAAFYELRDSLKPILDDKNNQREYAVQFISLIEDNFRDALILKSGITGSGMLIDSAHSDLSKLLASSVDFIRIEKAIDLLEETGRNIKLAHSTAYALKNMCLCI